MRPWSVPDKLQTHQFIQVNPAYYQLLGYSETEIASLTFDEITHPDDLEQDLHYMEQINQGKIDSFRLEKRYLRKNGEVMWGNLTLTVLRDQDGKPGFCLGMIEDITSTSRELTISVLSNSVMDLPALGATSLSVSKQKSKSKRPYKKKKPSLKRFTTASKTICRSSLAYSGYSLDNFETSRRSHSSKKARTGYRQWR
jgi:PAS domain S-box-containing protein